MYPKVRTLSQKLDINSNKEGVEVLKSDGIEAFLEQYYLRAFLVAIVP